MTPSLTFREALREAQQALQAFCGLDAVEAKAQAELLLSGMLEVSLGTLRAGAGQPAQPAALARFQALLRRRLQGEPVQYILGWQEFMGHRFAVDRRVLIPRLDTEILCECALERISLAQTVNVLDMCTGSGALAVSIALARPMAQVMGADISGDALALAQENARRNRVPGSSLRFVQSDLFDRLAGLRYDVIVSNPPYIAHSHMRELPPDVRQEPGLALDGGEDGLDFYRRLALRAPVHLTPAGVLIVEVGQGQAEAVAAMFAQAMNRRTAAQSVKIYEDLQGVRRVVCAVFEGG